MKLQDIHSFTQQCQEEWDNDLLFEMASIHDQTHGIRDVVIWVGMANKKHGLRVKVSNTRNKFDMNDHFVIQMPSLDYNPTAVAKWISKTKMNEIFQWIKLNQQLLFDYENGIIDDTAEFMNNLSNIS